MLLPGHNKVIAGSCLLLVISVLLGFVVFPGFLKSQLKKEMSLAPQTNTRKMWEKVPFPLDFKVYVFNYTNADHVQNGAIPEVQEIGPYYFNEWKEKVGMEDDEINDTVTYRKKDTFIFRRDLSGDLTGDEEVILPNIFLMSLVTMTLRDRPSMMKVLGKAVTDIFDKPTTIFKTVKVMDLLFNGVTINCDRSAFAAKATCIALKKEAADSLVFGPDNQYKFSIFGMQNNTPARDLITVSRGTKNIMDVGKVVSVNGANKLTIWKDHCNDIDGTDGTIFPPFLNKKEPIVMYAEGFCRTFRTWFHNATEYAGISTSRHYTGLGDLVNDPQLKCFCQDPASCARGLMDTSPCTKAPIYLSLPHYYDSDPKLLENVKGLNPSEEKHSQFLDFEPFTGTPLYVKSRIMFNLQLIKSNKFNLVENLPDTFAPLFWVEEGVALDEAITGVLKKQLFTPKKIVKIISWLLTVLSLGGTIAGVVMRYKAGSTGNLVKKISPQNESSETPEPVKIST